MIRIGPAGFGGNPLENIDKISSLGVSAVEVEFTYGVYMNNDDAKKLKELNKKHKLKLSIHAPYYINLAAKEKQKIGASRKRILDSCERGHHMGAEYIVFHAGFYMARDKEEVYQMIKEQVIKLMDTIKEKGWKVKLAPETTGKASQFGDLDELIRLKKETGCHLCVDFAHLKARNLGEIDYDDVMSKIKPLGYIHSHFSGIEWTGKGEKKHLVTEDEDIRELLSYLLKYEIDVTIINESPENFDDSRKMIRMLEEMKIDSLE